MRIACNASFATSFSWWMVPLNYILTEPASAGLCLGLSHPGRIMTLPEVGGSRLRPPSTCGILTNSATLLQGALETCPRSVLQLLVAEAFRLVGVGAPALVPLFLVGLQVS